MKNEHNIRKRSSYKDWEKMYEVLKDEKIPLNLKLLKIHEFIDGRAGYRYDWLSKCSEESLLLVVADKEKKNGDV